jgi:hypothetical protein
MVNRGVAPADLSTPIGQIRSIIGDVTYVPLVPPEEGFGDYTNFSDAQLQSYLTTGGNSIPYAVGYAYLGLAAQFAADSLKVTTDDEVVDLTKRSADMRAIASEWFNRGDSAAAADEDAYFTIVYPEFDKYEPEWPPELAAPDIEWWK